MRGWIPSQEWRGEDAYIVGGGDSLRTFDWESIRGRNVIGCNSSFILGHDVVGTIVFGDFTWWQNIGKHQTARFGGRVVGCVANHKAAELEPCPWLLTMTRQEFGLSTRGGSLGFNGNTGSLALNLALLLGAKRVFLLGFDMMLGEGGRPNFHDVRHEPGRPDVYPRFIREFRVIALQVPGSFPGAEVINVSNGSKLDAFPIVSIEDHFAEVSHVRPAR